MSDDGFSMQASALPEPEYFIERDMQGPARRRFASGQVAVVCSRSPLKEAGAEKNEDAAALIPLGDERGVLALADGVGGLPAGERASHVALAELARVIREMTRTGGGLRDAILDGIENANRAVLSLGGGATTLVVAEIDGRTVRSYHVGDSFILVTGQRGRVRQQTVAHSPVGYAVESGLLDEREAMVHEDRHLIDNMIGFSAMRIEIGPVIDLHERDTLLLASDGISDNLLPGELVELVRKGPLAAAAGAVLAACRARMCEPAAEQPSKPDDLSLIAYRPLAAAAAPRGAGG